MSLSLTHSPADGTLLSGTARGDGTAVVLKAHRWRWSRALGAWYLPNSRDVAPRVAVIERVAAALRAAGHDVDVDVEAGMRPVDVIEADREQRASERADRLAAAAQRAAGRAEQAAARDAEALRRLPPGGQPILVGHHSEGRHRRDLARAHAAAGAAAGAREQAVEAERRARVAAATDGARHAPITVANRVEHLGAQVRRLERAIAGRTGPSVAALTVELQQVRAQHEHWAGVRAQQIADGIASDFGRHNVAPGDRVRVRGRWYAVVRANARTVTVPSGLGNWTETAPWHEVTHHRAADQGTDQSASADQAASATTTA